MARRHATHLRQIGRPVTRARVDYDEASEAIAKYREFHRYDPKRVGWFPDEFRIPTHMYRAGRSKWVTYRSGKVDPATLRLPRSPVHYIHDHGSRVYTYFIRDAGAGGDRVDVPRIVVDTPALTRLGICTGFGYEPPDGEEQEVRGTRPMPDLYCTPCGRYLLVIQARQKVLAMMWGGSLGVFARGIDG